MTKLTKDSPEILQQKYNCRGRERVSSMTSARRMTDPYTFSICTRPNRSQKSSRTVLRYVRYRPRKAENKEM